MIKGLRRERDGRGKTKGVVTNRTFTTLQGIQSRDKEDNVEVPVGPLEWVVVGELRKEMYFG